MGIYRYIYDDVIAHKIPGRLVFVPGVIRFQRNNKKKKISKLYCSPHVWVLSDDKMTVTVCSRKSILQMGVFFLVSDFCYWMLFPLYIYIARYSCLFSHNTHYAENSAHKIKSVFIVQHNNICTMYLYRR